MDALAILKDISRKNEVGGAVESALLRAHEVIGDGLDAVSDLVSASIEGASSDLMDVSSYICNSGGKHVRAALCLLCYKVGRGGGEFPIDLAASCELLHNATLLHDDVIDEGDIRRGVPSGRMVFGNALSVLGGDYLLTRCVQIVAQREPVYLERYIKVLRELIEGEVVQLKFRNSIKISEEDYFRIVNGKTASLFGWATWSGGHAASKTGQGTIDDHNCGLLEKFGRHLGIAFQVVDDLLDYTADSDSFGKNLLADIGQGKLTLPAIYAIENSPSIANLFSSLIDSSGDEQLLKEVIGAIGDSGAIGRVKEKAAYHTQMAAQCLSSLKNIDLKIVDILSNLSEALLSREK